MREVVEPKTECPAECIRELESEQETVANPEGPHRDQLGNC